MTFKCNLCNKEFIYKSKLNEHLKNKKSCIKNKEKLICKLCNIEFRCRSEKERHINTKQHKKNENKYIITNNTNYGNINNIINNIAFSININGMNTFSDTDITVIEFDNLTNIITDRSLQRQINFLKKEFDSIDHNTESTQYNHTFIVYLIKIFKELNFNLNNPQNNNCKVLVFYNTTNKVFNIKHLVLNKNLQNIFYWNELTYKDFIIELLNLMSLVKTHFNLENLNYIVDYLNKYFKNSDFLQNEIKEDVEKELRGLTKSYNSISNNFNFNNDIKSFIKKETILPTGKQPRIKFLSEEFEIKFD